MMESWHDQLPAEYLAEPIWSALSLDAQIHYRCDGCGFEYRLNPTVCFGQPAMAQGWSCRRCETGTLGLVRHLIRIEAICNDCDSTYTSHSNTFQAVQCPHCQSASYTPIGMGAPGFPAEFGDIMRGEEVWGVDPAADAEAVQEEVTIPSGLPDYVRYFVPEAHFVRRLHGYADYPAGGKCILLGLEGELIREYFRRTGQVSAGAAAVQVHEESVEHAVDDTTRALAEHNVSMAVYSLGARGMIEVAAALMARPNLYEEGREAAERALDLHRRSDPSAGDATRIHIARIEHLLGDYIKVTAQTDEDRREALAHFDTALGEPLLPKSLRAAVRQSRADVLAGLETPTVGERRTTRADFRSVLRMSERDRVWSNKLTTFVNRAVSAEGDGDERTARESLERAAGIAQDELDRSVDELSRRQAAGVYGMVFDRLARLEVRQGRSMNALAAIETVRASSVSFPGGGDAPNPGVAADNLRWQWRALKGIFTNRGAAASTPTRARLDDAIRRLESVDGRLLPHGTAYVCVSAALGTVTGLIVTRGPGGLELDAHQWKVDPDAIEDLALPLESEDELFDNLGGLVDAGYRVLLEPLSESVASLGIDQLAVSLPGPVSRVPVEAMPSLDGAPLGLSTIVFSLPSLSLGAELVDRPYSPSHHLLIVTYLDDDLTAAGAELEVLGGTFDGQVRIVGGRGLTKGDILDAMTDEVSNIHFMCHGSFDPLSPLDSALHLVHDPQSDRHRITARDLAALRLPAAPVVTLAACSSALTSFGPANDLTGLTGAFIRAGARGVVGSRWNVHDDAASHFMSALYGLLGQVDPSPPSAVAAAQQLTRAEYGEVEDWAAFGYLGAP